MESSIGTWETSQWPHPQRRKNFLPLLLPIARGSSGKHKARKSSPLSRWKFKMTWFCVELMQTSTDAASVWVQSPCHVQKDQFTALFSLQPLQSFHVYFHTPRPTSELFGTIRILTGFMFWGTSNERHGRQHQAALRLQSHTASLQSVACW